MPKPKKPDSRCKYKKEHCDTLIDLMSKGFSMEAVAGKIGINRDTIYDWVKKYPEFAEAKELGEALCRYYYEDVGLRGQNGKIRGFNVTAWIFNMKNRFDWRDRKKDESEITVNNIQETIALPSPSDLDQKLDALLKKYDSVRKK